jgi:hypothetical protein
MYRKYSQDEVILITQSETEGRLGFKVIKGYTRSQPEAIPPHVPEGMFILQSLPPTGITLHPDAFVADSRALLEKVVEKVKQVFSKHMLEVVEEWEKFRDEIAPKDDDADRYVSENGMVVPLYNELFGVTATESSIVAPTSSGIIEDRVTFSASVKWSGRRGGHEIVAATPFVTNDTAANNNNMTNQAAPQQRRRRRRSPSVSSDDSNSSGEDLPQYRYIDLEISSSGLARDYFKYVNRTFDDVNDGGTFRVIGICEMQKLQGRKSANIVYAFKYVDVEDENEVHYTPVTETLNSYWAKWKDDNNRSTSSTTGRSTRVTRRNNASASSV